MLAYVDSYFAKVFFFLNFHLFSLEFLPECKSFLLSWFHEAGQSITSIFPPCVQRVSLLIHAVHISLLTYAMFIIRLCSIPSMLLSWPKGGNHWLASFLPPPFPLISTACVETRYVTPVYIDASINFFYNLFPHQNILLSLEGCCKGNLFKEKKVRK